MLAAATRCAKSQTRAKSCSNFIAIVSSMAGTETSLRRKDGIPSPEIFASYPEYYRIESLAPVFHHLNRPDQFPDSHSKEQAN
jgi:hypothetical protein